jgi:hypothetical protein
MVIVHPHGAPGRLEGACRRRSDEYQCNQHCSFHSDMHYKRKCTPKSPIAAAGCKQGFEKMLMRPRAISDQRSALRSKRRFTQMIDLICLKKLRCKMHGTHGQRVCR